LCRIRLNHPSRRSDLNVGGQLRRDTHIRVRLIRLTNRLADIGERGILGRRPQPKGLLVVR
jgi:hypothetical protein